MAMTEFQDKQIKTTLKGIAVWSIGIVSIVSSFWIGYSGIMDKLNMIENKIQIQNIRIDNEIDKSKNIHADILERIYGRKNES